MTNWDELAYWECRIVLPDNADLSESLDARLRNAVFGAVLGVLGNSTQIVMVSGWATNKPSLSLEEQEARKPFSPEDMANAEHDRIHRDRGGNARKEMTDDKG